MPQDESRGIKYQVINKKCMIKLRPLQQKAYNEFVKTGHIIVTAPRRAGKTQLLQYIIEKNKKKKIVVFTPNYMIFKLFYSKYKNCSYYLDRSNIYESDIDIGDEFLIYNNQKKTACAMTAVPKINKWINPYNKEELEYIKSLRKDIPNKMFKSEFGNYLIN